MQRYSVRFHDAINACMLQVSTFATPASLWATLLIRAFSFGLEANRSSGLTNQKGKPDGYGVQGGMGTDRRREAVPNIERIEHEKSCYK